MQTIEIKEISSADGLKNAQKGTIFVDVREPNELEQVSYQVKNIVNIPLSEFETLYTNLPKDQNLIMVCRAGRRSLTAASILINNGYDEDKIVNMNGGIIDWISKGLPFEGDKTAVGL